MAVPPAVALQCRLPPSVSDEESSDRSITRRSKVTSSASVVAEGSRGNRNLDGGRVRDRMSKMAGLSRRPDHRLLLVACCLCLAMLTSPRSAEALKIIVTPGMTECFSENVEGFHFSVPGGPRIDGRVLVTGTSQYYVPFVTVTVESPRGDVLFKQQHVYTEAHFNVPAAGPGQYKICFFNPYDSRTDAGIDLVYFTLAHLRRGSGGKLVIPKGTEEDRSKEVAGKDHMQELKSSIISMTEFVQVIMGSQRYLQRKLEHHEKIMTSSKARTLRYAWLEVLCLLLVMGLQVFAVTRLFEGSRVSRVLHV